MKRRVFFFLIIVILVGTIGTIYILDNHMQICTDESDMLETIGDELMLDKEVSKTLSIMDTIFSGNGNRLLVLCQLSAEYAPRYSAWEFDVKDEGKYVFKKSYIISDTNIPDIEHLIWNERYIIVVNNLKATSYVATIDGKEQVGTITHIPYVLDFPAQSIDVIFFDNDGRQL